MGTLVALMLILFSGIHSRALLPPSGGSYTNDFSATENPISDGGKWTTPPAPWKPMRSANGIADGPDSLGYFDGSAAYNSWNSGNDYKVASHLHQGAGSFSITPEVELHLRITYNDTGNPLTSTIFLYEIDCLFGGFISIVRWHGTNGVLNVTGLLQCDNTPGGFNDNDLIEASVTGFPPTITVWSRGVQRGQYTEQEGVNGFDSTAFAVLAGGKPGIGSDEQHSDNRGLFGWKDFSVSVYP